MILQVRGRDGMSTPHNGVATHSQSFQHKQVEPVSQQ